MKAYRITLWPEMAIQEEEVVYLDNTMVKKHIHPANQDIVFSSTTDTYAVRETKRECITWAMGILHHQYGSLDSYPKLQEEFRDLCNDVYSQESLIKS